MVEKIKKLENAASNVLYDRYRQIKSLGSGSFGHVYLVVDTQIKLKDDEEVYKAMKVMKKLDASSENEFSLLWKISHENILRYFEHFDHEIDGFEYTCVITEYCQKGDFSKIIARAKKIETHFKELEILDWIIQATNGLKYLHEKMKIVHRDIKPANILLTNENVVKLGDFGVAKTVSNIPIGAIRVNNEGSPAYMSPEQRRGRLNKENFDYLTHQENIDIWSLGCVLYELINLKLAYPDGQIEDETPIPDLKNSGRFSDILEKMLVKDPSKRISSKALYSALVNLEDSKTQNN